LDFGAEALRYASFCRKWHKRHHVRRFAIRYLLVATASAFLASGSSAKSQAISTIGGSVAQACYEAARDDRTDQLALAECDQALDAPLSSSDLVATHVNRGIIHASRRDYGEALADYERAIALDPDEAEAFLNKGLLLLHLPNREREAVHVMSLAIAKKTKMPALAYFARGVANEQLGQVTSAYNDYQQAAALNPRWELPKRELRRFSKR
jgi:tetratricopeptide (TPR) repeat protein